MTAFSMSGSRNFGMRGAFAFAFVAFIGCGTSSSNPSPPAVEEAYPYVAPLAEAVPQARQSAIWKTHLEQDLLPYWKMASARGEPAGNFPTNRGMDGRIVGDSTRYVRMLSRQTFAYAIGYLLTGDTELLQLAHDGAQWILTHAWDDTHGGWFQQLDASGAPAGQHDKYAQDAAYAALGLGAYFFVTRSPEAEEALLRTRDMLFDPTLYLDAETGRIKDGLDHTLSQEVDQADAGWELVAQLDPINAFMLLVQPVLSEPARQSQFLADLQGLGEVMFQEFYSDGFFWGIAQNQGRYRTRHVDYGHNLKAFWMIREVDKRLPDAPFRDRLDAAIGAQIRRAFDDQDGRWAKRPTSSVTNEFGSDWWIYAEADQIAATLSMSDPSFNGILERTQAAWLADYVDASFGEVIPGIKRDGSPGWNWRVNDVAKCNMWKNGYHSIEHAVIMYLVGTYLEGQPAELYFAVPEGTQRTFEARPYLLRGDVVGRTDLDPVTIGDRTLQPVRVSFARLR